MRDLNFTKCNDKALNIDDNFQSKYDSDYWYCLNFNLEDIRLGGNYDTDFFYYISIELSKNYETMTKSFNIINITEISISLPHKNSHSIDREVFFSIVYPSVIFQPQKKIDDKNPPYKKIYKTFTTKIIENMFKDGKFYFNCEQFFDDKNNFFEDYQVYTDISYSESEHDYTFLDMNQINSNKFKNIMISIFLEKDYLIHTRNFVKIQDIISQVVGIYLILKCLISFFIKYFQRYVMDIIILDNIFKYQLPYSDFIDRNNFIENSNIKCYKSQMFNSNSSINCDEINMNKENNFRKKSFILKNNENISPKNRSNKKMKNNRNLSISSNPNLINLNNIGEAGTFKNNGYHSVIYSKNFNLNNENKVVNKYSVDFKLNNIKNNISNQINNCNNNQSHKINKESFDKNNNRSSFENNLSLNSNLNRHLHKKTINADRMDVIDKIIVKTKKYKNEKDDHDYGMFSINKIKKKPKIQCSDIASIIFIILFLSN